MMLVLYVFHDASSGFFTYRNDESDDDYDGITQEDDNFIYVYEEQVEARR